MTSKALQEEGTVPSVVGSSATPPTRKRLALSRTLRPVLVFHFYSSPSVRKANTNGIGQG